MYFHMKLQLLVFILAPACSYTVISGLIGEDVILPCTVTHKEDFSYNKVNVLWSMKDLRVHSFFYGEFQQSLQDDRFTGRTQLYSKEFSKGNLSLLLKNVQSSDAGTYKCLVILEESFIFETSIELVTQDKTYGNANDSPLTKLSLGVVIICAISVLCVLLRRKKRSRGRTGMSLGNQKQGMKKTL